MTVADIAKITAAVIVFGGLSAAIIAGINKADTVEAARNARFSIYMHSCVVDHPVARCKELWKWVEN